MNKTLLLFLSFISLNISAQKAAKLYQKAQSAFDQKQYYDAVSFLDKLPKEEKSTVQYYKFMSLSLDSMRQYTQAIKYYTLYTEQSKDTISQRRLTFLKDSEEKRLLALKIKFEKIKDCPKCHGTDSVPMEVVCKKCDGRKQVQKKCSRCNGKGIVYCSICSGTGSMPTGSGGGTTCTKCGGTGGTVCTMGCDHGTILEDCRYCAGSGYATIQVKCDKHE